MSDYIDPSEATRVRVYKEDGGWAIDAASDSGEYTEACWNRDGHPDKAITRDRAMQMVPEFAAAVGLPSGLPIYVKQEGSTVWARA
jgi:hypothetical protein